MSIRSFIWRSFRSRTGDHAGPSGMGREAGSGAWPLREVLASQAAGKRDILRRYSSVRESPRDIWTTPARYPRGHGRTGLGENLTARWEKELPQGSRIVVSGEKVYAQILPQESLAGLRTLRPGLLLGEVSHGRFEPSEALAMVSEASEAAHTAELDKAQALRYLKGETLTGEFADGWNLITISGYPLGWGKGRKGPEE